MGFDPDEFGRRVRAIVTAPNVIELRAAVMYALEMLDIHKAWFLAPLTHDPRIGRIMSNIGFSRVWERQYRARLHLIDPLPDIALRQTGAFSWPEIFRSEPLSDRQRRYIRIAGPHGMASGIGTACYGPHGRSGFLGTEVPSSGKADQLCLMRFNMIGQMSFQRYCALIRREDEIQPLSNRELEVLQWIASGKSNSVIAELLGISPSSVDVYVKRIFLKLGVTDRTTASLKAFSLGLIVSPEYQDLIRRAALRDPGSSTI